MSLNVSYDPVTPFSEASESRAHGGNIFNPVPPVKQRRRSSGAILEGGAAANARPMSNYAAGPRTRRMRRSAEAILQSPPCTRRSSRRSSTSRGSLAVPAAQSAEEIDTLKLSSGQQLGFLGGSLVSLYTDDQDRPASSPSKLGSRPLDLASTMRKHWPADTPRHHEPAEAAAAQPAPTTDGKRGWSLTTSSISNGDDSDEEKSDASPTSVISKLGRVADDRGYLLARKPVKKGVSDLHATHGASMSLTTTAVLGTWPPGNPLATLRALHYMRNGTDAPLPRHLMGGGEYEDKELFTIDEAA